MSKASESFQMFFTEKHVSHDKAWMLQNSSSNRVCFACAVETLEDSTSLNVRKRKMLSDIMNLLMTNRNIWEIFTSQKAILSHTGNILLQLLSSKDKQLSSLVVETLGILVQKSREENVASLLESLVVALREMERMSNPEGLTPYFCFLGKLLRRTGSMVKTLLTEHNWLFELIVEGTEEVPENQALSYWYILAQIYLSEHSRHINIRVSKLVFEKIIRVLGTCASKDLQLNILSVLMSFGRNSLLCELVIEDENDATISTNSFVNMMKRLLLSTNVDIQRISVQCLTTIFKMSSVHENEKIIHFSQMLISKGLCEFLFELLGSPGRLLTASILSCLQHFANFTMFFSAGHVIYGIEPILESLKNAIKTNDKLLINSALQLLLKILQNSRSCSAVEKHTNYILEMMIQLSETEDTKALNLALSCATAAAGNTDGTLLNLSIIKNATEKFGNKLLKKSSNAKGTNSVDPGMSNLLRNTLIFVNCITRFLTNNDADTIHRQMSEPDPNTTQSNGGQKLCLEEVQHITDVYLIPSTVMLLQFVKDPEVIKSFFDMLVVVLSNDTDTAFATKLCESSFIRIALDIKAGILKEDPVNDSGEFIDNFLVLLICKLDDACDKVELMTTLKDTLPFLRAAPSDWHLFFNKASPNLDVNLVCPIRLACISLLYVSTRFGDPLWKMDVILRSMSHCILDERYLQDLTIALKRQVIFLWAYARSHSNIVTDEIILSEKSIISFIEKENKCNSLFIREKCFIHWVIGSRATAETKVWAFSEFLAQGNGAHCKDADIGNIMKDLTVYRNSQEFYMICIEILAFAKHDIARRALDVVSFVIGDDDDLEIYLQVKMIMNKTILSHGSQLNHCNILILLELYRFLLLSPSSTISDVDLKLASRLCNLFLEYRTAEIQVAVLNSLSQFLFHINKDGDSSKVAVLCNELFLKEVDAFIPRQLEYNGLQKEKSASAGLAFVSQLVATVSTQNFPTLAIKPFIVDKEVLILSMACSGLPLIQLACLYFWNCFFSYRPTRAYLFQSEEEPLSLCEDDLKKILIFTQNLLLNEVQLIREFSMNGMFRIMQLLKTKDKDFESPWNIFILVHLVETISPGSDLEFKLRTILFLLKTDTHVTHMKAVASSVIKLLTSASQDFSVNVIKLLLELILLLVKYDKLSVHQLTDIGIFLHSVEDRARGLLTEQQQKTDKNAKASFVIYCDVLLPVCNEDSMNMNSYLENITKCKNAIAEQQRRMYLS